MCSGVNKCGGGSGRRCEGAGILSRLLRPCLLLLVAEAGDIHGYELSPALEGLGLDVKAEDGRLYRALRHLEGEGLVRSEWGAPAAGPARRLYSVTGEGRESLAGTAASLDAAALALESLAGRIRRLLEEPTPPGSQGGVQDD